MIRKRYSYKLIFILFIIFGIINISVVNKKYPSYKNVIYGINEELELNGLKYIVKNFKIYDSMEFMNMYSVSVAYDQLIMLVELNVYNPEGDLKIVSLDEFRLETSNGWSSNIGVKSIFILNEWLSSYRFQIESNQLIKVYLPFNYYKIDSEEILNDSLNSDYYLNLYTAYPNKTVVNLKNKTEE